MNSVLGNILNDVNVPKWAKVIINCFQNLVVEREDFAKLSERISKLGEQLATKEEVRILEPIVENTNDWISGQDGRARVVQPSKLSHHSWGYRNC